MPAPPKAWHWSKFTCSANKGSVSRLCPNDDAPTEAILLWRPERHWLQDLTTQASPLVREVIDHGYRIARSLEILLEPELLTSDLPE